MRSRKLLERITSGAVQNVAFSDLQRLVEAFGFSLLRTSGSHHVYAHPSIDDLLNLQSVRGQGKSYQIRQFLSMVEEYNLRLKE